MSMHYFVSPRSVGARAALVLLATLLAHAFLLARVDRMLAGADVPPLREPMAFNARLLPPPAPPVAPQAAAPPAPKPPAAPGRRPAPADRPVPAMPPSVALAPAEWPAVVDVGPDAFGAEPQAAPPEMEEVAEAASAAEPLAAVEAPPVQAAAQPESFEATGEPLLAALAGLPELNAALPPSARYVYRTTNSELRLASGTSTIDWSLAADGRYSLRLTTTAIGVTVLELQSMGTLRAFGLAPERYTETRVRRGTVAANFDWDGRRVTFSARPHERPLDDGLQDRISFQFQLMLLGRARPEVFREGRHTVLRMAGRDDVSTYRFRSAGRATTATGVGELQTVRIERIGADEADARIEVWLAPSLGWLPARLRFTDRYGRVTESVLESVPTS
jgi:hypothetical protein